MIAITLPYPPQELSPNAPRKGRYDRDNLLARCKGYIDGIAAGLVVDDTQFEPIMLCRGDVIKGGSVVFEIYPPS